MVGEARRGLARCWRDRRASMVQSLNLFNIVRGESKRAVA